MTEVAEKLKEARALIERGWCQGNYQDGTSFCAEGAMYKVANHNYTHVEFLRSMLGDPRSSRLLRWNDTEGRTQAEVLDLFDRAIAKAQEQGV